MSHSCRSVNMYSHIPELTPATVLLSVYKPWATIIQSHTAQPGFAIQRSRMKSSSPERRGAGLGEGHHCPSLCRCTHLGVDAVLPPCVCAQISSLLCLWLLPSPHPPHTFENMGYSSLYHKPDALGQGWEPDLALNRISYGLWGKVARRCKNC